MSIVVYYLSPDPGGQDLFPQMCTFGDTELVEALAFCQRMRNAGKQHVCISSQLPNSVGRPGVDAIEDGKTPDGHDYTWVKRRSL